MLIIENFLYRNDLEGIEVMDNIKQLSGTSTTKKSCYRSDFCPSVSRFICKAFLVPNCIILSKH